MHQIMMRQIAFALACILCFGQEAQASLSITALGKAQGATSGSKLIITTGADCPVGSLIVIFTATAAVTSDLSSVTDEVSNSYATLDPQTNAAGVISLQWADAAHTTSDLPNGDTISVTFTTNIVQELVAAVCITGAATSPLDISGKTANGGATGATTALTVSSGTLSTANEVILVGTALGGNSGTFSCSGSWTKEETQSTGGSPTGTLGGQIVSSTSSVSSTACNTWATSQTYIVDMTTWKAAPPQTPRNQAVILQ
jgi:hypothetical protein